MGGASPSEARTSPFDTPPSAATQGEEGGGNGGAYPERSRGSLSGYAKRDGVVGADLCVRPLAKQAFSTAPLRSSLPPTHRLPPVGTGPVPIRHPRRPVDLVGAVRERPLRSIRGAGENLRVLSRGGGRREIGRPRGQPLRWNPDRPARVFFQQPHVCVPLFSYAAFGRKIPRRRDLTTQESALVFSRA